MAIPGPTFARRARVAITRSLALAGLVALGGCAVVESQRSLPASIGRVTELPGGARDATAGEVEITPVAGAADEAVGAPDPGYFEQGSGVFVAPARSAPAGAAPAGDVTLNFENTSALEVVKVILGDLLGRNYTIDPAVQGTVTLQTSEPLARDALLPTLQMLLRANGATVVESGGLYHVVPREKAVRGMAAPQLGNSSVPMPRGHSVRIVPLRYVSAGEMQKILEPFTQTGNIVRVDSARNLLILAGTGQELTSMLDTIRVFDVDWLEGMSVALFTPEFVDAKTLSTELEQVFGDQADGPLAGLVRIVTVERLNGLLVISPRPEYLARVRAWVGRLDRATKGVGRRLYVYHVQNGKAAELADVLTQVFEREAAERPAELAPGLQAATARSAAAPPAATAEGQAASGEAPPVPPPGASAAEGRRSTSAAEGLAISDGGQIRIIADEVNNAVLVMGTLDEYRQVQAALRQLDIVPLQVLIEATIAEITLSDELTYGLEWFFKNHLDSGTARGIGTLDIGAAGLSAIAPGFSYAVTDTAGAVRAVLNTLATQSRLNVISSPSLMVLNNQKASIQVGDQVPITTQLQQSTSTDANILNSVEFRDTGVLLSVTPRVNAGGLVIMEVDQEVSDVAPGSSALTPTIQQRKVNSTVAVQSGETVVLGGLIRENNTQDESGLPFFHQLPLIGPLFGRTSDTRRRTELVVLITPRAVRGPNEARRITEEFRQKMEGLKPAPTEAGPTGGLGSAGESPAPVAAARGEPIGDAGRLRLSLRIAAVPQRRGTGVTPPAATRIGLDLLLSPSLGAGSGTRSGPVSSRSGDPALVLAARIGS